MTIRPVLPALLATLALSAALPAAAQAQDGPAYVPGQVIVQYEAGATAVQQAAVQASADAEVQAQPAPGQALLQVPEGQSVTTAAAEIADQPGVAYAAPNPIARAAGSYIPNDPGRGGSRNWQLVQWNFLARAGINAPEAWSNLIKLRRYGGRGVTVAVLDTGVAYANFGRFRRSPDFSPGQFARGYDFVDRDPYPVDQNGHGTFVAGVIAERTNNGIGVTGVAYGARVMPVRVLDAEGLGDAVTIAAGIRYAAQRGAKVINLSLEFDTTVTAGQIPGVLSAVRYARSKGAIVLAASGNEGDDAVAYPARAGDVVAVGATTQRRCVAEYSNHGPGLDIVAPGGGADAPLSGDPNCRPLEPAGDDIFQLTFKGSVARFSLVSGYQGTSMATPHVSAAAALVIASGVIGARPSPSAVQRRLQSTARDLGVRGYDTYYGHGLLDAGAATRPAIARVDPPA